MRKCNVVFACYSKYLQYELVHRIVRDWARSLERDKVK